MVIKLMDNMGVQRKKLEKQRAIADKEQKRRRLQRNMLRPYRKKSGEWMSICLLEMSAGLVGLHDSRD